MSQQQDAAGSVADSQAPFSVDSILVEPRLLRVTHNGARRRLQPRLMALLVHLAAAPNEVRTRDQLVSAIWGEDNYIGDEALTTLISRLRKALSGGAGDRQLIETIPHIGYRLVARVEPSRDPPGNRGGARRVAPSPAVTHPARRLLRLSIIASAVALSVALGLWAAGFGATAQGSPSQHRVLVGAFEDRAENGRLAELFVTLLESEVDRTDAFQLVSDIEISTGLQRMLKEPDTPVNRQVGTDLARRQGASLLVLGRAERVGGALLLATEIRDPSRDRVLATESLAVAPEQDSLRVLQELTSRLLGRIAGLLPELDPPAVLAEATTPDLEALVAYSRAREVLIQGGDHDTVQGLLAHALRRDPGFPLARLLQARFDRQRHARLYDLLDLLPAGTRPDPKEELYARAWTATMGRDLNRATMLWNVMTELYPGDAGFHFNRAMAAIEFHNRPLAALEAMDRAVALARSSRDKILGKALAVRGEIRAQVGWTDRALADFAEAGRHGRDMTDSTLLLLLAAGRDATLEDRLALLDHHRPVAGLVRFEDPAATTWHLQLADTGELDVLEKLLRSWLRRDSLSRDQSLLVQLDLLGVLAARAGHPPLCDRAAGLVDALVEGSPTARGTEPRFLLVAGLIQARTGCRDGARRTLELLWEVEVALPAAAHASARRLLESEVLAADGDRGAAVRAAEDSLALMPSYQGLVVLRDRVREHGDVAAAARLDRRLVDARHQAFFECIQNFMCPELLPNVLAHAQARQRLDDR